jgi:hypothetical protein
MALLLVMILLRHFDKDARTIAPGKKDTRKIACTEKRAEHKHESSEQNQLEAKALKISTLREWRGRWMPVASLPPSLLSAGLLDLWLASAIASEMLWREARRARIADLMASVLLNVTFWRTVAIWQSSAILLSTNSFRARVSSMVGRESVRWKEEGIRKRSSQ